MASIEMQQRLDSGDSSAAAKPPVPVFSPPAAVPDTKAEEDAEPVDHRQQREKEREERKARKAAKKAAKKRKRDTSSKDDGSQEDSAPKNKKGYNSGKAHVPDPTEQQMDTYRKSIAHSEDPMAKISTDELLPMD